MPSLRHMITIFLRNDPVFEVERSDLHDIVIGNNKAFDWHESITWNGITFYIGVLLDYEEKSVYEVYAYTRGKSLRIYKDSKILDAVPLKINIISSRKLLYCLHCSCGEVIKGNFDILCKHYKRKHLINKPKTGIDVTIRTILSTAYYISFRRAKERA